MLCLGAQAQKTKKVTATTTFLAPEFMSPAEAKLRALNQAKVEAIGKEFGMNVSEVTSSATISKHGKDKEVFNVIGGSDIRGEWIETLSEPQYKIEHRDGLQIVFVTVEGTIREIKGQKPVIDAKILRNGTEPQYVSEQFLDGDEMFMEFSASCPGSLLVYMVSDGEAFRLLPYHGQHAESVKITNTDKQIFFSKKHTAPEFRKMTDEYVLTASVPQELNQIFVIFSPNNLYKAIDEQKNDQLPSELDAVAFQKWLDRARKQDRDLVVEEKIIVISERD